MDQDKTKIKYFLYARKSSESEDKQIQSIDDQIKHLTETAKNFNLEIVEIFRESKSAKKPNNRPLFSEMMKRIENGEATGILCWQINRLSRNPVDSGQINWLLQQSVIESIRTFEREYQPSDNVLLLSVESGMANQFVLDLSKNVKRGLQSKLEKGWKPGLAPVGYLNDLMDHTLVKDSERFDLLRRAWDEMLTGNYTVSEVLEKLNNEWGFRSFKRRRSGGLPLALSGLYKIFTNLFYTGLFEFKDKEYEGKHEPMITLEEYDRVQTILGRKGKPRSQKHEFAFTGFIRCAECGSMYTATKKTKYIKSTGETKSYTYYHCTRKKKDTNCTQRKAIKVEDLEEQIEKELSKITILPQFKDWAIEYLNRHNDREIEDRQTIYESQHKALVSTQNELDELTRMRYRQMIDDEMFLKEKEELQNKINKMKYNLRSTEDRAEKWIELTEKTFYFAAYARQNFINGDLETKKMILHALGQNPTIKDGKLSITPNKWLKPIADSYYGLEAEYKRLEPMKTPVNKAKTAALTAVITRIHGWRESDPR